MAYSELIKNFETIRNYMREFYVYGFRNRSEIGAKSARSYDNERRRIESWLGDYMSFRQDVAGRAQFLSVDSRSVARNPLYKAWKAKSFTDNDIILHFYILDLLNDGQWISFRDIVDGLYEEYFNELPMPVVLDESTIRNKLKEYVSLGILEQEKQGKSYLYRKVTDCVNLESWKDSVTFFSEINPMGVIGSYMIDKEGMETENFLYKHHYILYALDSEVLGYLLDAMSEHCMVTIKVKGRRGVKDHDFQVFPLRIYVSTQNGREHLLAYDYDKKSFYYFRLDNIKSVKKGIYDSCWETYEENYAVFRTKMWGVSTRAPEKDRNLHHIELTIHVEDDELYIIQRLEREKRNGRVEKIDENTYRYITDTHDATEMLPWIRSFIGRIENFSCSNKEIEKKFAVDLDAMYEMYLGGDGVGI